MMILFGVSKAHARVFHLAKSYKNNPVEAHLEPGDPWPTKYGRLVADPIRRSMWSTARLSFFHFELRPMSKPFPLRYLLTKERGL